MVLNKVASKGAESPSEFLKVVSEAYSHMDQEYRTFVEMNHLDSDQLTDFQQRLSEQAQSIGNALIQLQTLFNNLNEVFFSVAFPSQNLIQLSNSCQELYGCSLAEFKADPNLWFTCVLEEDRHIIEANMPVMKAGIPFEQEYRIRHKDGSIKWVSSRITPTLNEAGELIRIDGVSSDITQKRETELKLRLSQEHLIASQRIAHIGSWEINFDNEGNLANNRYWTDATYRIFGYDPSSIDVTQIRTCDHIFHEDIELLRRSKEALKRGENIDIEYRIVTNAGVTKYVSVRGEVIKDRKTEKPLRAMGTIQDITIARKSELEIQRNKANLRSILENTNIGYLLIDSEANILTFNHVANELMQSVTGGRLINDVSLLSLLSGSLQQLAIDKIGVVFNAASPIHFDDRFLTTNGKEIWLSIALHPIFNEAQKIVGVNISLLDITERKQLENERQQMIDEVEKQNRHLEQFAYIISHNLRAPVANLLGLSNIMQEADLDEMNRDLVMKSVLGSAHRADEVIRDLDHILHFKDRQNQRRESIDLQDLTCKVQQVVGDAAMDAIDLSTDFEVKQVNSVKPYLHSIFLNMISNALKYRDTNKVAALSIRSRKTDDGYQIVFEDNGLGINLDAHGRNIFGLYKRFHPGIEGKGMGLYKVKAQVESLNGHIWVESKVNVGTKFIIEFKDTVV